MFYKPKIKPRGIFSKSVYLCTKCNRHFERFPFQTSFNNGFSYLDKYVGNPTLTVCPDCMKKYSPQEGHPEGGYNIGTSER
jgi:hypothetical protein